MAWGWDDFKLVAKRFAIRPRIPKRSAVSFPASALKGDVRSLEASQPRHVKCEKRKLALYDFRELRRETLVYQKPGIPIHQGRQSIPRDSVQTIAASMPPGGSVG